MECWCAPDTGHEIFQAASDKLGLPLHRQIGADLGERMAYAARRALEGTQAVILIGGDCPVLQPDHLRQVLEWLAGDVDAVLGPAEDGGYVLLGLRKYDPLLFEGISWGEDRVLSATRERLQRLGWRWNMLETLWDLDRPADWLEIVNQPQSEGELAALRRCVNRGCPYGDANWIADTAKSLGLESTLRPRGRPKTKA